MAYARTFVQLTWGGQYFTDDIWVNGLHVIDLDPGASNTMEEQIGSSFLSLAASRITTAHQHQYGNAAQAKLDWVKVAFIGTDGKYTSEPIIVDLASLAGGRAGAMYPQLATAVSLRTAKKRGPGAYGRFYAPVALPVGDNGRVPSGDQIAFRNVQQELLTGLNADLANIAPDNQLVIGNVSKVGVGVQEEITGVFVGDLVDTQRRRRNRLNENYSGVTV